MGASRFVEEQPDLFLRVIPEGEDTPDVEWRFLRFVGAAFVVEARRFLGGDIFTRYSEEQERDEKGRWSKGGGAEQAPPSKNYDDLQAEWAAAADKVRKTADGDPVYVGDAKLFFDIVRDGADQEAKGFIAPDSKVYMTDDASIIHEEIAYAIDKKARNEGFPTDVLVGRGYVRVDFGQSRLTMEMNFKARERAAAFLEKGPASMLVEAHYADRPGSYTGKRSAAIAFLREKEGAREKFLDIRSLFKTQVELRYSPDQERDEMGRWTSGGGEQASKGESSSAGVSGGAAVSTGGQDLRKLPVMDAIDQYNIDPQAVAKEMMYGERASYGKQESQDYEKKRGDLEKQLREQRSANKDARRESMRTRAEKKAFETEHAGTFKGMPQYKEICAARREARAKYLGGLDRQHALEMELSGLGSKISGLGGAGRLEAKSFSLTGRLSKEESYYRGLFKQASDFYGRVAAGELLASPVNVQVMAGGRAYHLSGDASIHMTTFNRSKDWVHELGHHIDHTNPHVLERTREFLLARCANDPVERMRKIYPDAGYGREELAFRDYWEERGGGMEHVAYTGRLYLNVAYKGAGSRGKDYGVGDLRSSEILSMGAQRLYEDPLLFAKADPDYFKFVVGTLGGHI